MFKVLHIIYSGGLYGAELMLLYLVAEQIRLGLDPMIASLGERGVGEKLPEVEASRRGFKVKKFRMLAGLEAACGFRLFRFAQNQGFD